MVRLYLKQYVDDVLCVNLGRWYYCCRKFYELSDCFLVSLGDWDRGVLYGCCSGGGCWGGGCYGDYCYGWGEIAICRG